jgi:UDP-N-acetylmuramoyl-tripeptide--D-alanyl-D-alanine ligase
MVELGARQRTENRQLGGEVAALGADLVVVGRTNRRTLVAGFTGRSPVCVPDRPAAVAWVRSHLGSGDAVLYENDLPDHYP